MSVLLGNFVWEGLSTELPTSGQGAMDGHIFKAIDTGESYIRRYGAWVLINLGLSQIAATKSGRIITDENGVYDVTFVTQIINDEYTVALSCEDSAKAESVIVASFSNITATGFRITTRDSRSGQAVGDVVVSWLATRNYNP